MAEEVMNMGELSCGTVSVIFNKSLYAKQTRFSDINSKQFKCMLLDGACAFHISESTVSISIPVHYQRALFMFM